MNQEPSARIKASAVV